MEFVMVLSKEGVSRRIALWTALLTVHTVFLAAVFAVVLATRTPANWLITLVGFFSLLGILLSLLLLSETVTLDDERSKPPKCAFARRYAKYRPVIWLALSLASVFAFFACGVLFLYAIAYGVS